MSPEQIRAKQKAIQAYRQIISGLDVLRESASILLCDTPESLARMEADQVKAREGIEMLQSLPDTAEIFVIEPSVNLNLREDRSGASDPEDE